MEHKRLEDIEPERKLLKSNPELLGEFEAWHQSREDFNRRLENFEESAVRERWQRHYMRGETVSGEKTDTHQTKRRLKPPREVK